MALRQVCIAHIIKWAALLNRIEIGDRHSDAKAIERNPEMMASEASGSIMTLANTPKIGTVLKYTVLKAEDAMNAAKLMAKLLIKKRPVLSKASRGRVHWSLGIPVKGAHFLVRTLPIGTPYSSMAATVV